MDAWRSQSNATKCIEDTLTWDDDRQSVGRRTRGVNGLACNGRGGIVACVWSQGLVDTYVEDKGDRRGPECVCEE